MLSWSRRARRLGGRAAPALLLSSWLMLLPSVAVAASPFDGVSPSSDGLPGAELLRKLGGWGFFLALFACGAAILYGAATWRGMGTNSGRGVEGKAWVAAGCIGVLIVGLMPTIVSLLFDSAQGG